MIPIEIGRQRGVDPAQYVSVGNPVLPDFVRFAGRTLVNVRSDSRSALTALYDDRRIVSGEKASEDGADTHQLRCSGD